MRVCVRACVCVHVCVSSLACVRKFVNSCVEYVWKCLWGSRSQPLSARAKKNARVMTLQMGVVVVLTVVMVLVLLVVAGIGIASFIMS
jgi:hypothetical protein